MSCLDKLNDYQKSLLTRLAYLNIDSNKFRKAKKIFGEVLISELRYLIVHEDELYIGSLHMPGLKKMLTHIDTTSLELVEELESAGLSDIEIIDFIDDNENGFNMICFKDKDENMGFSIRGTDPKSFSSFMLDGLADLEGYLTNKTFQINEADFIFNSYKNKNGKNFIFGHSLGGFLAENVYLRNYKDIQNVFVVNPFNINSNILDSKEKVEAFNDKDKFSCFVIDGDYVSLINLPMKFLENIHYVKNSNKTANNAIGNHMIEAGEFDDYGNFVECKKENMFKKYSDENADKILNFMRDEKNKGIMTNWFIKIKSYIYELRRKLRKLFKRKDENKCFNKTTKNEKGKLNDFDEYLNPNNYPKKSIFKEIKKVIEDKEEEYTK